ncbi:VanZ family protein [Sporomusa sp. KB1]|uniref:VanZ family protein n=1 Tax=Sporomusa sp. KB1 TaxID=943346 RepID=UPI0011A9AD12|nr:VanZ family protein [Sporomusa sp. KB1]TWH45264.1 putative integral membrane protein [Sporomusa sp. KB1]
MKKVNSYYWYLAFGLMAVISVLSDIPNLVFFEKILPPELYAWVIQYSIKWGSSGFFSYSISPHPDYILHKLGHIFLFGFLGMALYLAMNRSVAKAAMAITLLALADEIHQGFTIGRSSRFGDVVLDAAAAMVFILFAIIRREKT